MKNLIEKIKKFGKNLTFEKSFVILMGVFLLSVIITAIISPTSINNVVNPFPSQLTNNLSTTPYVSNVDPNTITRTRGDTYTYQYGQIVIEDEGVGTYYFQRKPTETELTLIKNQLTLSTLNLIDETYKAVERTDPSDILNPPTSTDEVNLNLQRVGVEKSDEGIGPDAIVDGEEE